MTQTERQLLINQYKILAFLDKTNSTNHTHNVEVLESGHVSLYNEVFAGQNEGATPEIAAETHRILSMFRGLANAVSALPTEQQAQIPFEFVGFDANQDPHYRFAEFLITKQNLYDEYRGMYLNSPWLKFAVQIPSNADPVRGLAEGSTFRFLALQQIPKLSTPQYGRFNK
jgi:uncharacterized protein YfbU (UPF0304 family)